MKNILDYKKYNKLNEDLGFDDLTFKTPINNNTTLYNLHESDFARENNIVFKKDDNVDFDHNKFVVYWELDMDARNYGVKDLKVIVKKITGNFSVCIWGEDIEDEPIHVEFDSELLDYEVVSAVEFKTIDGNCSIAPDEIYIDFATKKITIE
jgi:hypothetical protein